MLLFVYGSLKEGFPNFHANRGRRLPGRYRTAVPYPFYLAGGTLPCLLPQPGRGLHVVGQLFEVEDRQLAVMDALERVGEPGGYMRARIDVLPIDDTGRPLSPAQPAFAYVQEEARLEAGRAHVGPIAEHTLEHAQSLNW
ncbi:MAG: gamma-glutamylcyclotransferase [Rubrivivax sp.]|nr:gamma-glutamylcyclotransferase [Rubrivivax sp.]